METKKEEMIRRLEDAREFSYYTNRSMSMTTFYEEIIEFIDPTYTMKKLNPTFRQKKFKS